MKTVFLYALCDPLSGRIRYMGKATDPYDRYERHLRNAYREKTHKACWIKSLLANNQVPILEIVDVVPENEWEFWEREWIKVCRILLFDLTNGTEGGDGRSGFVTSPEVKIAISRALSGRETSQKTRALLSKASRGRKTSLETRQKQRLRRLGRKTSADTRAKQSVALLSYWQEKKRKET